MVSKKLESFTDSQDMPFSLNSSNVNLMSPRAVLTPKKFKKKYRAAAKPMILINSDGEEGTLNEKVLSKTQARQGSLRDLYQLKKQKFQPQADIATP